MKKKLVGIIVFGLLISTAIQALGTMNEKEKPLDNFRSHSTYINPITLKGINTIDKGGIFIQLPPIPEAPNSQCWVSSSDSGYLCYEDFWNVFSPICDIHWWGMSLVLENGTWYKRDPEGMTFNISFWDSAGFFVCSYENVKPTIDYTGIQYWSPTAGFYKDLYYFETDLEQPIEIGSGWIGIQSTYCPSDGWFLWMRSYDGNSKCIQEYDGSQTYVGQDLAVVFTDGQPSSPVLECDGEIRHTKVPTQTNVSGSFKIRNNGDPTSVLQWRLDNSTIPSWGSNWTFNPSADFQTSEMDWLTVNYSFTAPDEKNKEFTGKLTIFNAIDIDENCEIDISVKTPRSRTTYHIFLLRIFKQIPNVFPILRQIFGIY